MSYHSSRVPVHILVSLAVNSNLADDSPLKSYNSHTIALLIRILHRLLLYVKMGKLCNWGRKARSKNATNLLVLVQLLKEILSALILMSHQNTKPVLGIFTRPF
jgi:hypothetical protein